MESNNQERTPESVAFIVEMATVLQMAREKVLSNDWRGALRLVQSIATPPLDLDLAVGILKGELTLVGESPTAYVDDADPNDPDLLRYLHTARWQKAGLWYRDGEFFQPYAAITGFYRVDETDALALLRDREDWTTLEGYRQMRARPYLRHPESDQVVFDIAEHPVVFKRVPDPAFWMPVFTTPAEAWAAYKVLRPRDLTQLNQGQGHAFSANDALFYLKGVLSGRVYVAQGEDVGLPPADLALLKTIGDWQGEMEDEVAELDPANPTFDERGIGITSGALEDQLKQRAYDLYYQQRIRQQADKVGGFHTLMVPAASGALEPLTVPRLPLLHWASGLLSRRGELGSLPAWDCVCPWGLKMQNDNPYHSDWWVGAGLASQHAYQLDNPVMDAARDFAARLANDAGQDFLKLAGSGRVTGPVVFPKPDEPVPPGSIAVVSHAGVDYEMALLSACKEEGGAVIAAVGGKLAHLATVSRETGARLLVVPDALTVFRPGEWVTVDLDNGQLYRHDKEEND